MREIADGSFHRATVPWYANTRVALFGALAVLVFCFGRYLITAIEVIRFPFGIDYGEGIVWQQMHMIMAGKGYGPIAGFPAIAFPYPPLYYVVTAELARATGMDELAAGRLLSVACGVAAAALLAAIVLRFARNRSQRTTYGICGVIGALIALGSQPVLEWSLLMRVDMLYVALSMAGFYLGVLALTRPLAIHAAALFFVAAIFTKQIAVAAPIAVFGTLLFIRPRIAWSGIATGLLSGLAALAAMMWLTDGGFLLHIVFYTITQFKLSLIVDILEAFGFHIVFCVLAVWGITVRLRRLRLSMGEQNTGLRQYLRESSTDAAFVMTLGYFLLSTLLLAAALKRGSSVNYFLEWIYLVGLFAGVALFDIIEQVRGNTALQGNRFAPFVFLGIAVQALGLSTMLGDAYYPKASDRADLARLVALIKAAPQPVISDDMVAVIRAGKSVQWEPFIFAELAAKGAWDEAPLVEQIRAHRFAFFVTEGFSGDHENYDERYDAAVAGAIRSAYPLHRKLAGYNLNFPSHSLPEYAADLR